MRTLARSMAGVAATGLAIKQPADEREGARIAPQRVPTALRAFWMDGFFGAAQDAFILAYLPLLAHALGASNTMIGVLAAAQSLGAMLALYPGAWVARRSKSRRFVVLLYTGVLGRLALFGTALAVAFLHGHRALWIVTALFMARSFFGNFTLPAWTSLAADIIPERMRAKYFASRNFAINGATLAMTPLGGMLLDAWGFPGGYVTALLVSFGLGMVATFAYSRIPEPATTASEIRRAVRPLGPRRALRNRRFLMFLLATMLLQFSTQLAGPFFNVYLKDRIGGTNFDIGWLSTCSALAGLTGQLVFGALMARRGSLWMGRVALLAMPFIPFMWLFVSSPWMVLGPNLLGGAIWAAFNLANFQHLLEVTEESEREGYVALFHTGLFLALFVAPFIGGVLADTMGYRFTFLLSGIGRVGACAMFFTVVPSPFARKAGELEEAAAAMAAA